MFQYPRSAFVAAEAVSGTSLSEILSAFSYALDLTEGQPDGHSVRSCWIGTRLGQAIGLNQRDLWNTYYAVLLKDLGCSANAARVAQMFVGDDRRLKHEFKLIGPDAVHFGQFIMTQVGLHAEAPVRDAAIAHLSANAAEIMTGIMDTRCTRGADIARKLRFSDDVAEGIAHLDEHWDGTGLPGGTAGEAIPMAARIALLAQIADVFFMVGGPEAACAEVALRRGNWLDPALVDAFLALAKAPSFWEALRCPYLEQELFALEPASERVPVDEDYLDDIATAFGQVIDAKSPFTGGHSERVGLFADLVATRMGVDPATRRTLKRAAILHDVGKLGVSSRVLEKPGKLDEAEWVEMRSHARLTSDILGRIGTMSDFAMIAGSHHERLDGKGYPLGLDARSIARETRIITVADIFDALTADRPYRDAMPIEKALAIMANEVGCAIDADCFAALESIVEHGIPQKPLPTMGTHFQ